MRTCPRTRCAWLVVWLLGFLRPAAADVDFNRDIRPILSDRCYACHGPDEAKRKAGLRLDVEEEARKALKSGARAVVPGHPEDSSLVARIRHGDPDEVMPPPGSGRPLTPAEIGLLTTWVQEGAPWAAHWAFEPPVRPAVPAAGEGWARNEIDRFVAARLEREGFAPGPEADPATRMRRVTLDLTGLPPTIEEMDAFLSDPAPDAYERLVDRLLQSPHYGERMAQNWLDLARFADTSGYHFDGVRFMWLWRDWVIDAFNRNRPFDQFTVEQLAGDLLPGATPEQRLATGFCRNNMTNDEGGADPDEYLNKYVVDRVNTLGAVWLGMTVGCSECHDHKFDPLASREFYQLYAFFHNVPEKGLDRIRTDNPPPRLPMPTPAQARDFVEADFRLRDAEKTLQDRRNELGETEEKWIRETVAHPPAPVATADLLWRLELDADLRPGHPGDAVAGRWTGGTPPEHPPGRSGGSLALDGSGWVEFEGTSGPPAWRRDRPASASAWVRFEGDGAVWSRMEPGPGHRGHDLLVTDRRFAVHLVEAWPEDALKVRTREQFPAGRWLHVTVTHDGSGRAGGVRVYVDGRARDLEVERDSLKGAGVGSAPFRVGARDGGLQLRGRVDDLRFHGRALDPAEVAALALEAHLPLLSKSGGTRTDEEQADLRRYYQENHAVDYLRAERALAKVRDAKDRLFREIPTAMVMEEMEEPRPTHVLVRGDFRVKGERVTPAVPAFLPPLPEGAPANRLGLARWLVDPRHPLTARVTVNRLWALFFGTGIVATLNDFGSQGEWPSHPELLDWLAVRFRDGAAPGETAGPGPWDVKGLVRLIVTSATYRQSAAVTAATLARDPYNRLFTRGPRLRLEAEFIRDNALAAAGLLDRTVGGPSVRPYQPPGIWDGTDARYEQDHGAALYRRGLYVFWRRSAHYPSFATFDAPNREVCTFLRQRTQTPLQSLVLMNDPVYVEAARGLAQRVMREAPDTDTRLQRAFRHVLGRMPDPEEMVLLGRTHAAQREMFAADPGAARALVGVGESGRPDSVDPVDLAALTAVGNVLLNLNEAITR